MPPSPSRSRRRYGPSRSSPEWALIAIQPTAHPASRLLRRFRQASCRRPAGAGPRPWRRSARRGRPAPWRARPAHWPTWTGCRDSTTPLTSRQISAAGAPPGQAERHDLVAEPDCDLRHGAWPALHPVRYRPVPVHRDAAGRQRRRPATRSGPSRRSRCRCCRRAARPSPCRATGCPLGSVIAAASLSAGRIRRPAHCLPPGESAAAEDGLPRPILQEAAHAGAARPRSRTARRSSSARIPVRWPGRCRGRRRWPAWPPRAR